MELGDVRLEDDVQPVDGDSFTLQMISTKRVRERESIPRALP